MNKVKVFGPLLLTAALASCQQSAVPRADQTPSVNTAAQTINSVSDGDSDGAELIVPDPTSNAQGSVMSSQSINAWPAVKEGSSGIDIKAVQYLLNARGYSVAVDGNFGPATLSAVKSFQGRNNLSVDGSVGPLTWAKLIIIVKEGSDSNAVKAVQNYLGITVDGSFGPDTLTAVKSFQSRNNLNVDGAVGPLTWQALVAGTSGTGTPTPAPTPNPAGERGAILARGKVWVDAAIPYSMNNSHDGWRTDCSGFVSMSWNLRTSSGAKISANTSSLYGYAHELSSPDDLLPGDAVDSSERGGATGGANHVVLFVKWIDKSKHIFMDYEEHGTSDGTIQNTRQLYYTGGVWNIVNSSHTSWHFLRKNGL